MTYMQMSYGTPFPRPPINKALSPGGWTILSGKSLYVRKAIETILDHMVEELKVTMPKNLNFELVEAGTQVVNGLNIYVAGSYQSPEGKTKTTVQAILYSPLSGGNLQISKIYAKIE